MRASNIDNFDFDGSLDDHHNFGWRRIEPLFGLRKRWFELVLRARMRAPTTCRSMNPNGSSNYALATSQLDFVKAFVRSRPRPG